MSQTNREDVAYFLHAKGLKDAAISGILGNIMVESGFNPGAANAGEGAIGLCQWEGGRRTDLQQFAAKHGTSETDLYTQLQFLWHELTTKYTGVLHELKNASTPADAARIFDVGSGGKGSGTGFENSSGDATGARMNYAHQFYTGGGPNPASTSSTSGAGGSDFGNGNGGGGGSSKPKRSDYVGTDGLGNLFNSVPQLRRLVDQAMNENWSTEHFQNQVENSKWYQNHSDTARSALIQQANDPASFQQALTKAEFTVKSLSDQLGMSLTHSEIQAIANHGMLTGNSDNQQWLTGEIGRRQDYSGLTNTNGLQGGMAATVQQLQTLAGDYGFNWTASQLGERAQNILVGNTTLDTYKQRLIGWAKSAFPGLSDEIDKGATVKDLADPYVTSMSQLLEQDPGSLNVYTPLIRKAMQGSVDPSTKLRAPQSLTDFEAQVRNDPRWQYTGNARDTMSRSLLQIGSTFGFGPTA